MMPFGQSAARSGPSFRLRSLRRSARSRARSSPVFNPMLSPTVEPMKRLRFLLSLLLAAPAAAATWDTRVQEMTPAAGYCVTGLIAGQMQTAACTSLVTPGFGLAGGSALAYDPTQISWAPRNRLLNSGFAIDQRNNGAACTIGVASGTAHYCQDRWAIVESATGLTAARTAIMAGGIAYAGRIQRAASSMNTNTVTLAQVLESAPNIDLQGKAVTFSFRARAGANWSGGNPVAAIVTGIGADQSSASFFAGSWPGQATCGSTSASLTASFAFYTVNCTIPVGAVQIGISLSWAWSGTAGAADYIDITDVELVSGTYSAAQIVPERPAPGKVLFDCRRYYESIPAAAGASYAPASGWGFPTYFSFAAHKRAMPTVTLVSVSATGGTVTVYNITQDQVAVQITSTGSGVIFWRTTSGIIADAEL